MVAAVAAVFTQSSLFGIKNEFSNPWNGPHSFLNELWAEFIKWK